MPEESTANGSATAAVEAKSRRHSAAHYRRLSSQLPCSPYAHAHAEVHRRLPQLFSETPSRRAAADHEQHGSEVDEESDGDADESHKRSKEEQDIISRRASVPDNFLGRVSSYNRLMHAHTKSQLNAPRNGTLPSYRRTMHAFTLNQLNHHRTLGVGITQSAPSTAVTSPVQAPAVPSKICTRLNRLNFDEIPHAPSNTPEQSTVRQPEDEDVDMDLPRGILNRRSVTEPLPREHVTAVKVRDFAGR